MNKPAFILYIIFFALVLQTGAGNLVAQGIYGRQEKAFGLLFSKEYPEKVKKISGIRYFGEENLLKSSTEAQRLDSIVHKEWSDQAADFVNSYKYNYWYGNEGRNISVGIYSWNSSMQKWTTTDVMNYFFNEAGFLSSIVFQDYFTSTYIESTKIEYKYSNSRLTEEMLYKRIEEETDWEVISQTTFEYDSSGLLIYAYINKWEDYDEAWIYNERTSYHYDENGNLILQADHKWSDYRQEWDQENKTENSYDGYNQLIESVSYFKGSKPGEYIRDERYTNSYRDSADLISDASYIWDYDLNDWRGIEKREYLAGNGISLFTIRRSIWTENYFSWEIYLLSDFVANKNLKIEDILYWNSIPGDYPAYALDSTVCDRIEDYSPIGDDRELSGFTNYYFAPPRVVSSNVRKEMLVKVYPNPAQDHLFIDRQGNRPIGYRITDIHGRGMVQSTLFHEREIDIAGLSPGVYFIEFQQEGVKVFSSKIIKR